MNVWWDASLYGLKPIDLIVIVGYFAIVMVIGFWVSRQVRTEEDFFLDRYWFPKRTAPLRNDYFPPQA